MGKNIYFVCLVILNSIWSSLPATAQINEPYLVKDINTDRLSDEVCSNFVELGGAAYFCGRSTDGISALWRTDGTEAGTFIVKQFASNNVALAPSNLVQVDGDLYFSGAGKLWKSDGTEVGTASIGEVTLTSNMVDINGVLYFGGQDNAEGWELWRTDGTEAGTFRVSNIIEGLGRISIRKIVTIGENLYFVSNDGIHGRELWKSDGTMDGTIMLKDINENFSGIASTSRANNLEVLNGDIIFFADDGIHGKELWKSDGSEIGTVMVKDIQIGSFSNDRSRLSPAFNSNLFFFADGNFWKTDGTENGTVVLDNINFGASESNYYYAISGERLYFAANDGTGEEIWRTDGVNSQLVEEIFPASSFAINELIAHEDKIYFTSGISVQSRKLWSLNAGTSEIELLANVAWSESFSATGLDGKLIFKGGKYSNSNRLWVTDGLVAETKLITDINNNSEDAGYGEFVETNNELYFVASDELIGLELWKTTGSAENTNLVHDINGGFNNGGPQDMVNIDGNIYFSATTKDEGRELWISDGTIEGTTLVKDIRPDAFGSEPEDLYDLNGILYFSADDSVHGRELWRSDGTSNGTYMIKDIYTGGESAFSNDQIDLVKFNDFVSIDNDIYFAATDGIHGEELWKSDGTAVGTVQVKDINSVVVEGENLGSFPIGIAKANGAIYFTAFTFSSGFELWRSDGSSAGTRLVRDIRPGVDFDGLPLGSEPIGLFEFNDKIVFFAYTDAHGIEMWISNGTISGTRLVKDIYPGTNSAFNLIFGATIGQQEINILKDVAIMGNGIFFAAWDGSNGMELWKTDGTPNGTEMVKDIKTGGDWSRPSNFTAIGDSFYFSADQGQATGRELWFSDGTQINTNIVTDLESGAQSSNPDRLIHALGRLFFTADDGIKGTELWALLIDSDEDGFTNDQDNCKFDANPLQENNDLDEQGDACDADDDNDGFLDVNDVFPFDPTEWLDTDSDGIGNNADLDDDNDGVPDVDPVTLLPLDNCPLTANPLQEDADEDGTGDACEIDESICFPIKSQSGTTALICL